MSMKSYIDRLNDTCRKALEAAAGLCVSRTNPSIELEHWLLKLTEVTDGDIPKIARTFEMDLGRAVRELTGVIERFKTGSNRTPAIGEEIIAAIRSAWVTASIELGLSRVRSGVLLAGLLSDDRLGPQLKESSLQFAKINVETLIKEFHKIVAGSREDAEESVAASAGGASGAPEPGRVAAGSKTPNLDQFCNDLTASAKAGKMDPVLGRDPEIRQVIDILTRRRQNNPILVGEAGVGKTAVVEGFALRIAAGDVPDKLKGVKLMELDLTLLQAGAGMKGEFENRLKNVIAEVKASPIPIILFIDEAHNMVGAGGQSGQGDAANLLKPALARGELRTIAATTWMEYRRYFEKDAALARRFQPVKVEEPDEKAGIIMMRGVSAKFEKHHGVTILEEAIQDSVRLSLRYIQGRQLPDKSVSLLDTACAKVAMSQAAVPAAIEELKRRIENLSVELGVLTREKAVGTDHEERLAAATKEKSDAEARHAELEKRFAEEKKLVAEIGPLRKKLEAAFAAPDKAPPAAEQDAMRGELGKLNAKLKEVQGDLPLMSPCVDSNVIAAVVSSFTGIPVGKMVTDEIKAVLNLDKELAKRVIGQDHALREIAQNIRTSRAKLGDQRKPIGVFLLVGPSGVGKTESAIALADVLYGGERNMVVINMSEYKEEHSVSNLKGSSKGLVGYGEGGVLTNAVRQKPYSVVLLDEIEKAHKQVHEVFFQVFDKGMMEDSEAREVDFKNTVILLTCNVGTDMIMKLCADPETAPDAATLATALRPELLKVFPPALLGRLSVVPFFPLSDSVMKLITKLQLGRIARRVAENHRAAFTYDDSLVETIVGRCKEVESGARNIEHILSRTLLPELAAEVLGKMAAGERIGKVHVSVGDKGAFTYAVT